MKRSLAVILAIGLLVTAVLFIRQKQSSSSKNHKTIAIANLQKHPILDAVEEGVLSELKSQGYEDGKNLRLVLRNANGDMQRVAAIANDLASQKPDVIVAISTPIAQAVANAYKGPIVFGALTNPISAGLVTSMEKGEEQITGTSDALPYDQQLKLIRTVLPKAERLGLLFNPGEAASEYAVKEVRRIAPQLGFKLIEGGVNSTNDVYPVARGIANKVDVFLISTDNTVAAGIAGAVKVAIERRIPLFACDSGSVEKGAIGAVSPGYFAIGQDTGKLVVRVLKGEKNIPTVLPKGGEIYLNTKSAELMGVIIPAAILSSATKTFGGMH